MHYLFQLHCFSTEFRKNLSKWLSFICKYYQIFLCWLFGSKDGTWLPRDAIVISWFCSYQRIYTSKSTEEFFPFFSFPRFFTVLNSITILFVAISPEVRCTKGWSSDRNSGTKLFRHTEAHLTFFSPLIIFYSDRSWWWYFCLYSFKTGSKWLTLNHLSVAPSLSVLPHIPPASFHQRLTVVSKI